MKANILLFFLLYGMVGVRAQNTLRIDQATLRVTGPTKLVLQNTQFRNGGTFVADTSTVIILGDGTDVQSAIGGDSISTFYNLEINKTANGSQLQQVVRVENELRMTAGNLDLNGQTLTLGEATGRIVGEAETSRITGPTGGFVTKTVTLNAPTGVNPGNIGCSLTSTDDLGTLTIRRGHVPQELSGNTQGIARYFEFDPPDTVELNVTAQLQYFDAELNGVPENALDFWRNDANFWFNPPSTGTDATANTVDVDGINLLTRWTLGPATPKLSLRVLLEGAYDPATFTMRDDLRTTNNLPTQTPYAASAGYDYGAGSGTETILPIVFAKSTDDAIVDWVFVELRSAVAGNPVVTARAALLQRDGDVVELDGQSPLSFPGADAGAAFFLTVRHRNHLGIRSQNTFTASATPLAFDFTTNGGLVLGGTNGIKLLNDGSFALFAGDFDGDGQIQLANDLNGAIPTLGQSGYLPGDFDLNGQVQNTEIQLRLTPNLGRGAQFNY
ncbi:MAG: hypothetical protein AAGF89_01805 [Bacteroidota bacterium]